MSGPKTSRYTLTTEYRRILEEQRRLEYEKALAIIEERKKEAKEKINSCSSRLIHIDQMLFSDKKMANELVSRNKTDGGFQEKYEVLNTMIIQCKSTIANINTYDLPTLEKAAETVSLYTSKAEAIISSIQNISEKNKDLLFSELNSDIDSGFETQLISVETEQESETDIIRKKMISQLEQFNRIDNLPIQYTSQIENSITNISEIKDDAYLKNYIAIVVKPLIKNCDVFLSEYEQRHVEFDSLYTQYRVLCELYHFIAQEYTYSAESIASLKNEIKRIKEMVSNDDEQSYISKCIDEVMNEMGYSILGSREVTKKSGTHFRNELYTYNEETAVSITYSSDGKIAMELGGIDTSDRLPDAIESAALCNAMEAFCTDFHEIEKRLLDKGVIPANRISLSPPKAEYAQIINISDYNVQQHIEKSQSRKRRQTTQNIQSLKVE